MQGRRFQECLRYQNETIQIQSQDRRNDPGGPPDAGEMKRVARQNRNGQQDQREAADYRRRQQGYEGEKKPGYAGQRRAEEKDRGYTVEALSYEQSVQHDETGSDSDQADNH